VGTCVFERALVLSRDGGACEQGVLVDLMEEVLNRPIKFRFSVLFRFSVYRLGSVLLAYPCHHRAPDDGICGRNYCFLLLSL
jgi:hypothetical protein